MMIPKYARYDFCVEKACIFLESYDIIEYPVDPFKIISINKWGLMPYSELAQEFQCTLNDVCISLGSNDGFTIYDGDNFTIAYNDSCNLGKRIIFTLFHEIGHIYLNHLIDFEHTKLYRGSLTKEENKVLENEANAFARNVSAPAIIICNMQKKSKETIATYFSISKSAAKTRLDLIQKDISTMYNSSLITRMNKIYYRFKHKKNCITCDYFFIHKNAKYCPICGKHTFKWRKSTMKYSDEIAIDNNSKALKCPVCDNEEVLESGKYCHICGIYLVNKCTNDNGHDPCGKLASSNARYCIYCGAETTFKRNNLLKDWKIIRNEIDQFNICEDDVQYSNSSNNYLPDGVDEELPFN